MNRKCTLTPNSLKELDDMLKNDSVIFFHSANCGHCKKTVPVIEELCEENESDINIINCPVEKNYCRERAQDAKVTGVPVVMGVKGSEGKRNIQKNLSKPKWKIVGAKLPEITKRVRKDISGESYNAPSTPAQQPPPPQVMPPRLDLDKIAVQLLGSSQTFPTLNTETFEFQPPKKVELCVPGKECTNEEFTEKFIDFYVNW